MLVEHWQNCDDAGAEKLLFKLDLTEYPRNSLVDERAADMQGPALILASSLPLDASQIGSMRELGSSKKRDSFQTTGRFGVGLNCMYVRPSRQLH